MTDTEKKIISKLETIERISLLAAKQVLTFDDLVLLTGLKKSYLYRLTSTNQIPHYKPHGKSVYFDKNEIEAWLKQNPIDTVDDAAHKAARRDLMGARA